MMGLSADRYYGAWETPRTGRRTTLGSAFDGVHERRANQMLADEPGLHFVGAQHVADRQVIRPIVP